MKQTTSTAALCLTIAVSSFGCGNKAAEPAPTSPTGPAPAPAAAPATIVIDGSSTVFPITEAVAEEFQKANPARVTIGISGTGGGFKKLCAGETAVGGASRPVKVSELEACAKGNIKLIELPVAYDGIVIVTHKDNTWVDHLTVAELKVLWEPAAQGKVLRWNQIRASWPDAEVHLFGPGVDSGTYDYFTAAVVGTEHASRGDFTSSEDDNVLVQGVATDKNALGFFGFGYYSENAEKLKLIPIDDGNPDNGAGPITASPETVASGTYQPLSRPVFIYISQTALGRSEVASFVDYYMKHAATLAAEVGFIPLPSRASELATRRLAARTEGSAFGGAGSKVGVRVEDVLGSH